MKNKSSRWSSAGTLIVRAGALLLAVIMAFGIIAAVLFLLI